MQKFYVLTANVFFEGLYRNLKEYEVVYRTIKSGQTYHCAFISTGNVPVKAALKQTKTKYLKMTTMAAKLAR